MYARLQHGYHAAVNCLDLCSVAFAFENCNAFHTFKVPRFQRPRITSELKSELGLEEAYMESRIAYAKAIGYLSVVMSVMCFVCLLVY